MTDPLGPVVITTREIYDQLRSVVTLLERAINKLDEHGTDLKDHENLIELVRSGQLAPGDAIPSAAKLMEQYDCSISPVRDAIRELKVRGLLAGMPGRAVYVNDPLPDWI